MAVISNLDQLALDNELYLNVIDTGNYGQVTIMKLLPGEEIEPETHADVTQITKIVTGYGKLHLKTEQKYFDQGDLIIISPGKYHHFINDGTVIIRLWTYYTSPEHLANDKFDTEQDYLDRQED